MPVILDGAQAPTLDALLAFCTQQGIQVKRAGGAVGSMLNIAGIGTLAHAGAQEISFLSNPRYQAQLGSTRAAAVLLSLEANEALEAAGSDTSFIRLVCAEPYLVYALLARWFDERRQPVRSPGIHPSAVVDDSAQISDSAVIGPQCVVEAGASIGPGTRVGPGCIVGRNSRIGADGVLHARVTLYDGVVIGDRAIIHSGVVLGADGFGFAPDPRPSGGWFKIAQLGGVLVGNDVEIGANTTIDRGALDSTTIGDGVKLDNQIMVAHNVRIGAHSAVAACVGIAGSTVIGERCTIAGAAMLSGHLTLADDVHVSGGTAITSSIHQPGRYTGVYPYAEHTQWQKNAAVIQQLGQLRKRVRAVSRG